MKEKIKQFAISLGADDVGIVNIVDYHSPRTPDINTIFPEVRSMVVMAIREMSHVESDNPRIAMNGRLDVMEHARSINYSMARFLEKECGAKAMTVPGSYPLEMSTKTMGVIADVSLRHAAVAAGLGAFGRHNLVIHPKLGPRVLFAAVLTDLELASDPPVTEDLCIDCGICVEECPAQALEEEGLTDCARCLKVSQPYGLGKIISFWNRFIGAQPEEQRKLLMTDDFWGMYQAQFIGFQYHCFKCYASCPLDGAS
ncbi:MAG: 4Fe-4S binding protein [Deltaproteobacteria bacterium]